MVDAGYARSRARVCAMEQMSFAAIVCSDAIIVKSRERDKQPLEWMNRASRAPRGNWPNNNTVLLNERIINYDKSVYNASCVEEKSDCKRTPPNTNIIIIIILLLSPLALAMLAQIHDKFPFLAGDRYLRICAGCRALYLQQLKFVLLRVNK